MSVISNNLVFNGLFVIRSNLNYFIFSILRFLQDDKMTADLSAMIKN